MKLIKPDLGVLMAAIAYLHEDVAPESLVTVRALLAMAFAEPEETPFPAPAVPALVFTADWRTGRGEPEADLVDFVFPGDAPLAVYVREGTPFEEIVISLRSVASAIEREQFKKWSLATEEQ